MYMGLVGVSRGARWGSIHEGVCGELWQNGVSRGAVWGPVPHTAGAGRGIVAKWRLQREAVWEPVPHTRCGRDIMEAGDELAGAG